MADQPPKPSRRSFLKFLGATSAGIVDKASIPPPENSGKIAELLQSYKEISSICEKNFRTLDYGIEYLNEPTTFSRLEPQSAESFASRLKESQKKLQDAVQTRQHIIDALKKEMGNNPLIYPHDSLDDGALTGIIKDGMITPESFAAVTDKRQHIIQDVLREFIPREAEIISKRAQERTTYNALEQALRHAAPNAPDYKIKDYMEEAITQIPKETDWTNYFKNQSNLLKTITKVVEQEITQKESEKKEIENEKQSIAEKLQSFFGLEFKYDGDAFYAEIPLHGNEQRQKLYSALKNIMIEKGNVEIFPDESEIFINERIINHANNKVQVPLELPVPKLYEFRLDDSIASNLVDILEGKIWIREEEYRSSESFSDIAAYYREQARQKAKPYETIADNLETLRTLGKGMWINRLEQTQDQQRSP